MSYTTIVSVSELAAHLQDPAWAVFDCRALLADPGAGHQKYLAAHIPGALFADLKTELSGPVEPGRTGRHPLPAVDAFVQRLSSWGVDAATQVVAYDDAGGAFAARLWWLLRWLGHDAVAVLDGDWRAWEEAKMPVQSGNEVRPPRTFVPHLRPALLVTTADLVENLRHPRYRVFDARAAERYRGENETIDPIAGHIPGAISAPFAGNLGTDGRFLPPETLRARWTHLLGDVAVEDTVMYCGSGVTAVHNLIALEHAGLGAGRLYAGSWSEWITDPERAIAVGRE